MYIFYTFTGFSTYFYIFLQDFLQQNNIFLHDFYYKLIFFIITKENKDGSLILEYKITKEEEILPTIFHWLPHIKVIEPKWLDDKIREILKQY